jgi:hypothetical protein
MPYWCDRHSPFRAKGEKRGAGMRVPGLQRAALEKGSAMKTATLLAPATMPKATNATTRPILRKVRGLEPK